MDAGTGHCGEAHAPCLQHHLSYIAASGLQQASGTLPSCYSDFEADGLSGVDGPSGVDSPLTTGVPLRSHFQDFHPVHLHVLLVVRNATNFVDVT